MKKILVMAMMAAVAVSFGSCVENEADEQMEALMLKGGKTEQTKVKPSKNERNGIMLCKPNKTDGAATVKDKSARGKDKNEKNGIMPLETRSVAADGPIRHPLLDGYTFGKPIKK